MKGTSFSITQGINPKTTVLDTKHETKRYSNNNVLFYNFF